MADVVLVGANLATLVAAAELGAAGRPVVLLTDGRPVGGHFRGLDIEGHRFDVGMVTLERPLGPTSCAEPDLAGYDPDRRYDWTRFAGRVDRWQAARADLRRTPTPEVLVEGRRSADHLMSDRLDPLAGLGGPPLPLLDRADPRHASAKTTGAAYDRLGYREAALANHGAAVQGRLVDPFVTKVLGPAGELLLARYHRAAWLPLYWPETVAAACRSEPTAVVEHPFWTTATGRVGELVHGLEDEVTALPTVTVDTTPVQAVTRDGGDLLVHTSGGTWRHPRPVLGLPTVRARALLGQPPVAPGPSVPLTVLCCLVRASAMTAPVGCLLVVDPGVTAYRVTDQDAQAGRDERWRRVTVEAGVQARVVEDAGEDLVRRLVTDLVALLGLPTVPVGPGGAGHPDVRVLRLVRAPGALGVPTAAAVAADRSVRDDVAAGGAVPTGGLLGTGLNSLADQIVQGLRLADEFG